jgi:hypothetical protein
MSANRQWLCGSQAKDAGHVILNELKFVREETQSKVKKLRLATDVHIGE